MVGYDGWESKRQATSISLPIAIVEKLDKLVEEGQFINRSEAIRYFLRWGMAQFDYSNLHKKYIEALKTIEDLEKLVNEYVIYDKRPNTENCRVLKIDGNAWNLTY